MLKNLHLVGENEEDDLYSEYKELDTEELYADEGFQQALKTSYGNRPVPGTAARGGGTLGTAMGRGRGGVPGSSMGGRPVTGLAADGSQARPMTAVRAAGYSSAGGRAVQGANFDPLNQSRAPAPPLESKSEDAPEEKIRQLEKKVNELIEESCQANEAGDFKLALEKAKEAGKKERLLVKQREQSGLSDQVNLDITYSVLFNLANQYHANQMHQEAINSYQVIVRNKMFSNAGRLRVNMGNIYFEQRKYSQAIKQYRMALDQIPNTHKEMRIKIMQNIALVFIKLGQYSDAVTSYEHIMGEKPEVESCFNLLLCYYAMGDREKMKKTFQRLVQITVGPEDEEKYNPVLDDPHQSLIVEIIRNDPLRQWEKQNKSTADRCIIAASKLISPVIEVSFDLGFDWCIENVRSSPYIELSNELEITKAITYLKMKDFTKAIETLKTFEKKDSKMASQAAVNLSFLYFLEGDTAQADKHADIAIEADHYNPAALVNKGNCSFKSGDLDRAKISYQEALNIEASCTEAIFNLGLVHKKLGKIDDALDCFHKLQAIIPNNPEVLYQLADLYEKAENLPEAMEWYHQLLSLVPSDPAVLSKLGEIYDSENEKSQAFHYYFESFKYHPSNIETISWLGAYYVDAQFVEKAMHYFERAALVQPNEVKWQLMVASCHRRTGNYQLALDAYKTIHRKFPENIECLKFLVRLCTDQGLDKEVQEFAIKLKKAEKAKELREQRAQSGTRRGSGRANSGRSGSGRAGSGRSTVATSENSLGSSAENEEDSLFPVNTTRKKEGGRRREVENNGNDFNSSNRVIDASYADPLGEAPSRPKTAGGNKAPQIEDEFGDEELGDDLLPE
ncbi:intraflagellar transport protein 88 homolog isoform X1 [Rhopilema esculentum]|uniref:intraflagellar transport protein 88 homolog isoform X1 n=1 Tax=Rhopilema esculentum TaxID=499914 RepID=UPI0031D366CE